LALSASTVWEVRGGAGSDTNGGGFVTGATGTDWSQQNAAQYSVTDGVTAGTTTITSATANFGTDVVGNIIYVQGGTGAVAAGWYQITVRNSATSITVDRSTGLTAGTGVTLKIGGALATLGAAAAVMVARNWVWVKSATYSISSGITLVGTGNTTNRSIVQGYSAARGDTGKFTLSASAGSITMLTIPNGCIVDGFILDGNGQSSVIAATMTSSQNVLQRGKVTGVSSAGAVLAGQTNSQLIDVEVVGCTAGGAGYVVDNFQVFGCNIHGNTGPAARGAGCANSLITGNSNVGWQNVAASGFGLFYNTIAGNGSHGVVLSNDRSYTVMFGNLLSGNGGYGVSGATDRVTGNTQEYLWLRYNAFYNNTSGQTNAGSVSAPNITLTADPFTNSGSGDYSLNNTAGGGAACRAAGFPGAFQGGLTTGYLDIGAAQHQDSGGSSSGGPLLGPGRLLRA
jgi:hypothetical protein